MADTAQGTSMTWATGTIGNVIGINGQIANEAIDTTTLSDTWKAAISGGLADGGDVTVSLNWEPDDATANSGHQVIVADVISGTSRAATIVWNSGTDRTWSFTAFATNISPAAAVGDKLTADLTFRVSGAITPS